MKHVFIVNPTSGQGGKNEFVETTIRSKCDERKLDYIIHYTTGKGEGKTFVDKFANDCDDTVRFYACGGDGTVYDVVNGAYTHKNAQLAVIPLGSGNDFVRFFDDKEAFLDMDGQLDGDVIDVDLINCGDDVSINVASMGFCAESCAVQGKMKKIPFVKDHLSYVFGGFYCCIKYVNNEFTITVDDDKVYTGRFMFAAAGNGRYYGSGIKVCPYALPDDGYLDFEILERRNIWPKMFVNMMGKWQKNFTHIYLPNSHYIRGKKMVVKSNILRNVNVDGECRETYETTFEIMEKAIKMCIPKTSTYLQRRASGEINSDIDPKATK